MTQQTLAAALSYAAAGLSVIPCQPDKLPDMAQLPAGREGRPTWEPYRHAIADEPTLRRWFANGALLAIVGGAASGGLLIIDFDERAEEIYPKWRMLAGDSAADLPVIKTRKGYHVYLRCEQPPGNMTLAAVPDPDDPRKLIKYIETRGEGGYAVAPPSEYAPGRYYELVHGDLTQIPLLEAPAVAAALDAARVFDERPLPEQPVPVAGRAAGAIGHGTPYAHAALRGEAQKVAATGEGDRNNQLNRSAYRVGRFVGAGLLAHSEAYDELYRAGKSAGLKDREIRGTLKSGLDDGMQNPVAAQPVGESVAVRPARLSQGVNAAQHEDLQELAGAVSHRPPKLLHANDLDSLPPQQWLLAGELPASGLVVLYGPSSAGKSFIALNQYALPIAQSRPVIYIAGEGASGYRKRKDAWCSFHKQTVGSLYFWLEPVRMLEPASVEAFLQEAVPAKPALIIVDTLARCMVGGDENSSKDMGLFVEGCARIQDATGAAVMVLHHTDKKGGSERGSSALRAAADAMIELSVEDDILILSSSKTKDSEPFKPRKLRLASHQGSRVVVPASVKTDGRLTTHQRKVLEMLSLRSFVHVGALSSKICSVTGIPEGSLPRTLSALMEYGYVDQGKKGDPFKITTFGERALEEQIQDEEGSDFSSENRDFSVINGGSPAIVQQQSQNDPKNHPLIAENRPKITQQSPSVPHAHARPPVLSPPLRGERTGTAHDDGELFSEESEYQRDQRTAGQIRWLAQQGKTDQAAALLRTVSGTLLQAQLAAELASTESEDA